MNKYLLSVCILIFSQTQYAQTDYVSYYHLCRKADSMFENNKLDSASAIFTKAFDKVPYIHIKYLETAKKVEKKRGNSTKEIEYSNLIKKNKTNINQNLQKKIDSLIKEDQKVRTYKYIKAKGYYYRCIYDSTFTYKNKKFLKSKNLMKIWWETDSLNINALKNIISEFGFPGERLVGNKSYNDARIIILHYDKDKSNKDMESTLNKALNDGDILPKDYAWIIDRHLYNVGKKQRYYSLPFDIGNLTVEEKEEYNKNRISIGLCKLEELKISNTKTGIKIKY